MELDPPDFIKQAEKDEKWREWGPKWKKDLEAKGVEKPRLQGSEILFAENENPLTVKVNEFSPTPILEAIIEVSRRLAEAGL